MILSAPAKINWFLRVEGRRDDGYHDIVSPMQRIDLFDTLIFEDSGDIELVSDLDVPRENNLVYKAARLLRGFSSHRGGARITLKKEVPVAAGLGGGSSDAAATLMGLNRLWGLYLDNETLMGLGAALGSDVPFFMGPPFSLAEGRGEIITPLASGVSHSLLLVNPGIAVSSGWAYNSLEKLTNITVDIKLFCRALDSRDYKALRQYVFNDLEPPVIRAHEVVASIKRTLLEHGAELSVMSGSGPTVFGVFSSREKADEAAGKMKDYWCRVVNTITGQ
ncbi:MAG: 4-(cytidine 5'-diphospho)-2-C-methyl-D-erythritol kinase [Nitrospirae bacterium]|nr:4-(cytidine 5'-diphospho)-2-C-methyl-D-erythritol kinase [Nitrospirota bacterium]